MRCPACGQDNPAGARFCNACGSPLTSACPACAHPNPPASRFCNACGAALGSGPPAAAPDTYTPPHLAERIIGSRSALEGERKQVTVLFADLKGSLELLADRDPEEARRFLDPVLHRMMDAVHRYEGTVNQVMGDGIMALFGAPLAHEDHAVRACYAALVMQETVSRYGDEVQRTSGVPIQIRVGLNSGEVVVRSIGSDLRMDYSAVGQTTHLAARMEQMAKPGSILLTVHSMRLAEGYVEVRPLGPASVKGLAQPLEVFELLRPGASRTRLAARAVGGLTPFVGRDAELDHLRAALERAGGGHGEVVAVVGEAGVGKSRLARELIQSHRTADWLTLEASGFSYGKATPCLPVIDLLKTYFGIEDHDDARRVREKVMGRTLALDAALAPELPAILALLAAPGSEDLQPPGSAEQARRVREAVRRLFARESQARPIVLVVEDLHWLDEETQGVLDALVESLPTMRGLLLVNYRPDYQHGWASKSCYTQIRLDPLGAGTAQALLDALMGGDPGLGPLRALLIDRTQGNPFFLEECVRGLVESGVLAGERGAYRLERPTSAVQVPATVQAVLAARIDRLLPEDKQLLQTAAAIGTEVPLAVLEAVAGLPPEALRVAVARLQSAEMLYETRIFPDVEYAFTHALTHDVAYAGLLGERRRALHAKVLEALERLYPDRVTDLVPRLAHHAFRGEVWGKALRYLRQTAEAGQLSLDATMGSPESAGRLWWTAEYERAIKVAERDLAVAASFGNFPGRVVGTARLGQTYHTLGEYPRAEHLFAQIVGWLQGDLVRDRLGMAGLPAVFARAWLGWCLAEQGRLAAALAVLDEALVIAENAAHDYSLVLATWALGGVRLVRREPAGAIPVLERGVVITRQAGIPLLSPFIAAPLGAAYALAGRAQEAVATLEQAVEDATAIELRAQQPLRLSWLAEAYLAAGRPDQAATTAARGLQLAQAQGERGSQAHALLAMGEIAARRGVAGAARAEVAYREALAIARELGLRPLEARCHLGLGALCAVAGPPGAGQESLATAIRMFEEMDLPAWRDEAAARA